MLKLEFVTEAMEYLRPVLRETRSVEESAEAIIPDSCPDITEILYTGGAAFLRGRELGEGSASISVGVSAMVLAQPEGRREPEVVEVYIPMSLRIENPALKPGMLHCAQAQLRRIDSHLVNPRKVSVRAVVSVTLRVWEPCVQELPADTDQPNVELLRQTLPLRLMVAAGEKSYTVEDVLPFTPEGTGRCLAGWQVTLSHSDARLTGTRAVLRGSAAITAMYLNEEGETETRRAELPFSQHIDLGDCAETDELRLNTCLTGADVELTADGRGLSVTLQLMTWAEVWAQRELRCIGDMYVVGGQAVPEWTAVSCESLLDRQCFAPVGRGTLPGGGEELVFLSCLPGEVSLNRAGERAEFTLPVQVQLVTRREGRLQSGTLRVELQCATQAAPGCRFEAQVEELTASAAPGAEGWDVKVTGTVCVQTFAPSETRAVTGGEVTETAQDKSRPGLILRRAAASETLWDIGKQYGVGISVLQQVNGLSGEPEADMLLLIPGR